MLYLLDADTLITSDRKSYPMRRFPVFWDWLQYMGEQGTIKIAREQYDEVTAGRGTLVDWLDTDEVRDALLLGEEADPARVDRVLSRSYGRLNEVEIEQVGQDPFLISYATVAPRDRTIVTFEVAAPNQRRGKRKIPDACAVFNIATCNVFAMIDALDFTTDWHP